MQEALLLEACRSKDRLDLIHAGGNFGQVGPVRLVVVDDDVRLRLRQNQTAKGLSQLLAALRLPDIRGKRPQLRSARGFYAPRHPSQKGRPPA